jgi:protein-tyrosine phosphatase
MKRALLLSLLLSACASSTPSPTPDLERPPVRVSSQPSTVPGITIPNAHVVGQSGGKVLRGMAPWTKQHLEELAAHDVREVLIFRNDDEDGKTVQRELALLRTEPRLRSVVHVPFPWKDTGEFKKPCEQTIEALRVLKDRAARGDHAVYFHCTMGEDRTGYLAALYRVIFEGAKPEQVFRDEMCRWGYADGSPVKPKHIAEGVHAALTPTFLKLVKLHEWGLLTADHLDPSLCAVDPAANSPFRETLARWEPSFRCRK